MTEASLHPSADGKGRTIWEIITGQNKKDMTPLELQYHNPLGAKVGCTLTFANRPEYAGVYFVIEKIVVYKTTIRNKDFFMTDYCCKGNARDWDKPERVRLRLIPDEDSMNELGHQCQLLKVYADFDYDKEFEEYVQANGGHLPEWDAEDEVTFKVNYEHYEDEVAMEQPWRYWRVDDVVDPYEARATTLADDDGSGTIEDDELEHASVTYWDFHRTAIDEEGEEITEFFNVERDDETGYFYMLKGTPIHARSITLI